MSTVRARAPLRLGLAGGGGFMLFFVPPERRMAVLQALEPFDGEAGNCHFTQQGCQAWRV